MYREFTAPLAGANFYLTGVRDAKGTELMYFEIPLEKYLTAPSNSVGWTLLSAAFDLDLLEEQTKTKSTSKLGGAARLRPTPTLVIPKPGLSARNLLLPAAQQQIPRAAEPRFGMTSRLEI